MRLTRPIAVLGILLTVVSSPTVVSSRLELSTLQAIAQISQGNEALQVQEMTEAAYLRQSYGEHFQRGEVAEAIAKLQKALAIYQKWKARGGEWQILNDLGEIHLKIGQYPEAMAYLQKALSLAQGFAQSPQGDALAVPYTLQYIADAYDKQRQYPQALSTYQQALKIFQQELRNAKGDRNSLLTSISLTLASMGSLYFRSAQYDQALSSYQQLLQILIEVPDPYGRLQTLNNMGVIYANKAQYAEALTAYNQALELVRSPCCTVYKGDESAILNNLSALYFSLGQNKRALELADQSTKIYFQLSQNNFAGLRKSDMEFLYDVLGEENSNPNLVSRGLSVRAAIGDVASNQVTVNAGKANNFNNLAHLYSNSGRYAEAIAFFQRAKAIYEDIGNDLGVGITLDNIGSTYSRLGQVSQAITFHQQALAIYEKVRDRTGIGVSLNNLGRAYANLNKQGEAIASYQKALSIAKEVGDLNTEALVLANIGDLLTQQKQIEIATAFLKQSVNIRESIRQSNRLLPREDRAAYKQSIAYTYRYLANLLIQQGRIYEAIQILDLLKVQEIQDYLRDVKGNARTAAGITLLAPEQSAINSNLASLLNGSPLAAQIRQASTQQSSSLLTSQSLIADVQKFGDRAALFYPLQFEDQIFLVLLPARSTPVVRSVKIKPEEFTAIVKDFRADLQDAGSADVKYSSQILYKYLIQPLEKDLQQNNTELLLYAPDGQMRYIPLAALYDGKQWLIERFSFNYLTSLTTSGFLNAPTSLSNSLKVVAAAFTKGEVNFKIGSDQFTFTGLTFAGQEIERIANTFPNTTKLIDNFFSRDVTVSQFSDYNLIHLATHAAFISGTPEDSFLLMGNGDRLNLRELREWKLPNTQLVVLSACQTALGGIVGNGEEILGFGYQIQRTGARAAIASLWTVSDQGTQLLMANFYTQLQQGSNIIKSLREAQLKLVHSQQDEFQHPYFWSAFILIGDGK
ncbi:MAG: CHAT domain-containing protein [Pseudanabaenaceae cyanobacterium bins.39]|nr:CHAT domain-containing protein [Pseudanabaenaceae cyanobacterium bins.39]